MMLLALVFACSNSDDSGKADTNGTVDTTDTDVTPTTENAAPSAPVVAITPTTPSDADPLTVTIVVESVDPEGAPVSYAYAWAVDGTARTDLTAAMVPDTETADGDLWEVQVTPSDGEVDGSPGLASVTVGNRPPSAPVIHIEPAAPVPRDDLTIVFDSEAVDPEGDALTTTIHWYENDVYFPTRDGLITLDGIYVDGGDEFVAEVSVSDGVNAAVVATATVVLPNEPPVFERVTVSPTSALDDDDIVVTAVADDPDGGYVSYRYVWFRDGAEAVDVGDTDTVPAAATVPGEHWTVVVYGSDGHDEVSQDGDQEAIVVPWTGSSEKHIFTLSLTADGAGGYDAASGQWALDYLAYGGTTGNQSCELRWAIDATENSRYCRDCAFSFESNFVYDPSSQVDFGCTDALMDGSGYFFFNETYGQFNGYNTGPGLDSRTGEISMRIVPDSNSYSFDGTTLSLLYASTTVTYDVYGNAEMYMYLYSTEREY